MFVITVKRYNREAKMTLMTLNLKKEKQYRVFFLIKTSEMLLKP
jgi:hypothetical protein